MRYDLVYNCFQRISKLNSYKDRETLRMPATGIVV